MALSVTTSISIEGNAGAALERTAARLRAPSVFMRRVGVLGMTSAATRLSTSLKMDRSVRSGRLMASLQVTQDGRGSEHTVFELSDLEVTVGSNLRYAKQLQDPVTIVPAEGKALAIPLPDALKRAGLWPRDLDPSRILLEFVPYHGGKPNIIGFLVDPGEEALTPKRKRPTTKKGGTTGYGPGPLFVLVSSVTQEPNPYLFWSDADRAVIENELWPQYLGLN